MGVRINVLIPKKKLPELTVYDIAQLLSYYGRSWYSLPEYLQNGERHLVTVDDCMRALYEALEDYRDCKENPEDYESSCDYFLNQALKISSVCRVLWTTGAVFISDVAEDLQCDYYKRGYISVLSLLKTEDGRREEEWFERECR